MSDQEKVLMAYAYGGSMGEITEEHARMLTHVNHSFGLISEGVVTGDHLGDMDSVARLKRINPSIKVLIALGGWGAGGFSEAASTPESLATFCDSAVQFMKQHGYDGIDIDWEYPCSSAAGIASSPDDKVNYTKMLKGIRERLDSVGKQDGKVYLLTTALPGSTWIANDIELGKVVQYLDYLNLMTYDFAGAWSPVTGHHTNLYSPEEAPDGISGDKSVEIMLEAGFPASKIVLGAAFYGRAWIGVDDINHGLGQPAQGPGENGYTFNDLVEKYIGMNGFVRYWDESAKAPYLFDGNTFITYEDEESLREKAKYVKERGLAGIMFWQYGEASKHTLVNALHKAMTS